MTDDTQSSEQSQTNGQPADNREVVEAKAAHRQEMTRIEHEHERQVATMVGDMPLSLQLLFNPIMRDMATGAAQTMAAAVGITPPHLLGKPEACFAVVSKALTWKLDPFSVAQSTYQIGGKVAYEGKLVQAIMEASGRLAAPLRTEYFGPWDKIDNQFTVSGNKTVRSWKDNDEIGIGIRFIYRLVGDRQDRTFDFFLMQAQPRNSAIWPNRPRTMLHYAGVRALASTVCPSVVMGVPFEDDFGPSEMRDVTPSAPTPEPVGDPMDQLVADTVPLGERTTVTAAEVVDETTGEVTEAEGESEPPAEQKSGKATPAIELWIGPEDQRTMKPGVAKTELFAEIRKAENIGRLNALLEQNRGFVEELTPAGGITRLIEEAHARFNQAETTTGTAAQPEMTLGGAQRKAGP